MTDTTEPFNEFPYRAMPIECTAPERLALASMFHGGPRVAPLTARVLELGCANGANLLPMAWYRRDATFVGIDGSSRQIETAERCRRQLGLSNLRFVHADFRSAAKSMEGKFEFIIIHGVVSWITEDARNDLFELCADRLAPGGLLYLNYNSRPGWNIRGLVRQFLLEHTSESGGLEARAHASIDLAARLIEPLGNVQHHYTLLMASEFKLIANGHPDYLAHEYLAPQNVPWWRSEFMQMCHEYGFDYVADADFNSVTNSSTSQLRQFLTEQGLSPQALDDSIDMLCYQQMHSPIMSQTGFDRVMPDDDEFASLLLASNLAPSGQQEGVVSSYRHKSNHEIQVNNPQIRTALIKLWTIWPQSRPMKDLFPDIEKVREEIEYLTRINFVEMRCAETGDQGIDPEPLHRLEADMRNHTTTPQHRLLPVEDKADT